MFRRILLTALIAGLCAGLVNSVVQQFTTTPIILHAETFENGGGHDHKAAVGGGHGTGVVVADTSEHHDGAAWAPRDGIERTLFTTLANVIAGIAFALLLGACFALYGGEIDGRRGVLWGLAGFAVFSLAPALGLPPEVPGSMAADLASRQGWWFLAAAATALGLWLMEFGKRTPLVALGIVVLAAPHLIGAPQPDRIGGAVPPELAAHFVAASLVTAAVFWATLGWLGGTLYKRLG